MNCVVVRAGRLARRAAITTPSATSRASARRSPAGAPMPGPIVVIGAGGGARAVLVEPDRPGRARNPRWSIARLPARRPWRGNWAARSRAVPWDERARRARRRGHADQHHQPGHGRRAAARAGARHICRTSALVSDIIYIPRETPLLAAARKRGNPAVNGLGMLLHQARPAFQRLVRHHARGDAGAARNDRGDDVMRRWTMAAVRTTIRPPDDIRGCP